MKQLIKVGIVSVAIAATAPSFAQETISEEGPIGWTPVALGVATPVQLPWGINRWDVFGLDLNVFYSDAPTMCGLDIGGLASVVRDNLYGLQIGGLLNLNCDDVYGARVSLGLNYCGQTVYGFDAGLVGYRDKLVGCDVEFLGSVQRNITGLAIGGLANITAVQSYGCTIAGLTNLARTSYGLQLALAFNMTDELHGAQIGLVNYADYCPSGFQIGLINIIMSNQWKVLPIVNGYF